MSKIEVIEVGPRDGFQSVKCAPPIATELKLKVIDKMAAAGVKHMEYTSFVSPKAIPQLADAKAVTEAVLKKYPDLDLSSLENWISRQEKEDSGTERRMRQLGLVDIGEVDPTIAVHLVYATSDNFAGKVLYRDIRKAFLLPEAAGRLAEAQRKLKLLRPELSLLVYDAARPMKVQQEMWDLVKGTENRVYVSNPRNGGGLHNYGAAVDLTLVDSLGHVLPMGSEFDYFGEEARPDREEAMVKQGRIILPHLHNRRLLRKVMTDAGFRVLPSEWWHFNLMSRAEARVRLKVIE